LEFLIVLIESATDHVMVIRLFAPKRNGAGQRVRSVTLDAGPFALVPIIAQLARRLWLQIAEYVLPHSGQGRNSHLVLEIPILKSSRLTLRAIRADDHSHLVAMSQDAEIIRHLHEGPAPSAAVVWQRMAMALGQWALRGYGMMAVDDNDGFVGRLCVHDPYDAPDPQIGYILCKRGWGKGYATEGVGLILDWMFTTHRP
jgi:RimJ/RimL family protein N-acetyltransferase